MDFFIPHLTNSWGHTMLPLPTSLNPESSSSGEEDVVTVLHPAAEPTAVQNLIAEWNSARLPWSPLEDTT